MSLKPASIIGVWHRGPANMRSRREHVSAITCTPGPRQAFRAWVAPKCEVTIVTVTFYPRPRQYGNGSLDEKNSVDYATDYVLVILALLG